jgi:hypothetical protein
MQVQATFEEKILQQVQQPKKNWSLWPASNQQGQNNAFIQVQNQVLNFNPPEAAEVELEIDLNQSGQNLEEGHIDPRDVIVNPVQPIPADDFMELNDLNLVHAVEVQMPQNLDDLADQFHQQDVSIQNQVAAVQGMMGYFWNEEIPLDELVGPGEEDSLEGVQQEEDPILQDDDQPLHQNLNFGMVLLNHEVDPAMLDWKRRKTAEATRLWAKFFSKGNAQCLHVQIPSAWSNFFTVTLLSPNQYSWAKDFLSSKAINFLVDSHGIIDFFLPNACPVDGNLSCSSKLCTEERYPGGNKARLVELEAEPALTLEGTLSKKKGGKRTMDVVDSNLRRSPRLKHVNGGFKPSVCTEKSA